MSSSSSNSSGHVTSCSNDTSRAAHDDGQRPRGTGAPPVPDSASALAGLPLLKPKMSQIVRYIGNHGGDLWSETRCVTHGMLREELHTIPNYPLEKTVEKVKHLHHFYIYTLFFVFLKKGVEAYIYYLLSIINI